MASAITSAGSGSGMDFESIIQASLTAKKNALSKQVDKRLALAESEQKGVNSLKSALKAFKTACEDLTKDNSMNTHKVTTTQSTNYNAFTVTTKADCTNTNFDIAVTQLAKAESVHQNFNTADGFKNSFAAGKITIDLGEETYKDEDGLTKTRQRSFSVDVQEGDSLELIRKRLNQNDFDLNVGLIKTDTGYSFTVNSGSTGKGTSDIKISTETTGAVDGDHQNLDCFNFDKANDTETGTDGSVTSKSGSKWGYNEGKDATVIIDGQTVTSHTNRFDEQISGLTLEVNQLSEKETDESGNTGFKSYNVSVTTDSDAAKNKMQSIIDQYNSLMSKLNDLYKRDTYDDGKNNYDGGDLAGDSQLKSIQNALSSMVVRYENSDSGKSIFDCGLNFAKDGTLSLDSTKFKDAINNSFNSVVNLFTGDEGLLKQMSTFLDDYTQTGGILDTRKDNIQKTIDTYTAKQSDNDEKLAKYEESLRNKYGNLDSLMSSYNSSLSYIQSLFRS